MGTVDDDDDYRCPWCGQVGNGGYVPDPLGYPICTEGFHSCLWGPFLDLRLDLSGFRLRQLYTIFIVRYGQDHLCRRIIREVGSNIAEFLNEPVFDDL